jgi:hypothetical protein
MVKRYGHLGVEHLTPYVERHNYDTVALELAPRDGLEPPTGWLTVRSSLRRHPLHL